MSYAPYGRLETVLWENSYSALTDIGSQTLTGQIAGLSVGSKYWLKMEVLKGDLNDRTEFVQAVRVNDKNEGSCNPVGGTAYDCTWHLCWSDKQFMAKTNIVNLEAVVVKHAPSCRCNTETWDCEDARQGDASLQLVDAAIRFTATKQADVDAALGVRWMRNGHLRLKADDCRFDSDMSTWSSECHQFINRHPSYTHVVGNRAEIMSIKYHANTRISVVLSEDFFSVDYDIFRGHDWIVGATECGSDFEMQGVPELSLSEFYAFHPYYEGR